MTKTKTARKPADDLAKLQEELTERKAASDRLEREYKLATARAEALENQLADLRRVAADQRRLAEGYGAEEPALRERWSNLRDYVERRLRMVAGDLDAAARKRGDLEVAEHAEEEKARRAAIDELKEKTREGEWQVREAVARLAVRQQAALETSRYALRLKEQMAKFEKEQRDVDRAEQEGKPAELYADLRQLEQALKEAEPLTPDQFLEKVRDATAAVTAGREEVDAAQQELQHLHAEIAKREGG